MIFKDEKMNLNVEVPREKYACKPVSDLNTETLPEDVWLKWREHGPHYDDPTHPDYIDFAFGGSSQGAISNCEDAFMSSLEYYHEKIGNMPLVNKNKDNVLLKLGHIYERSVGEKFLLWMELNNKNTKCNLHFFKKMVRCMKKDENGNLTNPYVLCDVDGILEIQNMQGQRANIIYEAKTITSTNYEKINMVRRGEMPMSYRLQLAYYMFCFNLTAAVIVFSWGQGLDEMAVIWVERDYDLEAEMLKNCDYMYQCLQTRTEPDHTNMVKRKVTDFYSRFLPEAPKDAPVIQLDESYKANVDKVVEIYNKRKALQKELDDLKMQEMDYLDQIAPIFGVYSTAVYPLSETEQAEIKLSRPHFSDSVNEELLQKEHPDVYQKYLKTSFNVTTFKKESDEEMIKKYLIKGGINPNPGKAQMPHFDVKIKKIRKSKIK